jgi:hypothetical protein
VWRHRNEKRHGDVLLRIGRAVLRYEATARPRGHLRLHGARHQPHKEASESHLASKPKAGARLDLEVFCRVGESCGVATLYCSPPAPESLTSRFIISQGSAKDSETVDFEDELDSPSMAAQGPITHLLLVVHGVGQKMESASIVRETKKLRRAVQLGSLRINKEARVGGALLEFKDPIETLMKPSETRIECYRRRAGPGVWRCCPSSGENTSRSKQMITSRDCAPTVRPASASTSAPLCCSVQPEEPLLSAWSTPTSARRASTWPFFAGGVVKTRLGCTAPSR